MLQLDQQVNLNISSSLDDLYKCKSCPLRKSHRLPYTSSHEHSGKMFDLVYVDSWTSPIIASIGVKYFLLVVDDHSRFMWVYFLSDKSQPKTALSIFKAMGE